MKLLVLSPVFPDAPRDGDRVRLWHWVKELEKRHQVTVLAPDAGPWARRLAAGLRLASGLPVSVTSALSGAFAQRVDQAIAGAGRPFDAVFCYRLKMAPYALRFKGPRFLDYTDSLTRYAERRAAALALEGKGLQAWWWRRQARQTAAYEAWCAGQFDGGFFNSRLDCDAVRAMAPDSAERLQVAANGVAPSAAKAAPAEPGSLAFIGHLAYAPNAEAVLWFVRQVLPLVRAKRPDAVLTVIGGDAPAALRALEGTPGLRFVGPVAEVAPALQAAQVSVCPVLSGAGRQNKLLEAFAAGVPAVSTRFSAEGAEAVHGRDLLVADGAPAFAQAVLRLLDDAALRRRLASGGRALVARRYRWAANAAVIHQALERAKRRPLW